MKKTLTINLGGLVYHIDEDAYTLLDNYLNNLRIHFGKEKEADEIVRDMEMRISELFGECLHQGKQVITIEDVERVIEQMGNPDEFETFDERENEEKGNENGSRTSHEKRLYRDPDNKMLGGVAAGIAAYFGWDPTMVRIGFILLGISGPWFLFFYLAACVIIPEAGNASEKLSMRGIKVNIENIGKAVTESIDQVNNYVKSKKPNNFFHNMAELFVNVVSFLIKIITIVAAIFCLPLLFVFLIICTSLLMVAVGFSQSIPDILMNNLPMGYADLLNTSPVSSAIMGISGIFMVGIPIYVLIHFMLRTFGNAVPMTMNTRIVLFVIWLFSIGSSMFFFFNSVYA